MKSPNRSNVWLLAASSMVASTVLIAPMAHAANGRGSNTAVVTAASQRPLSINYTVKLEDQLLAILQYLPVSFQPNGGAPVTTTTSTTTTTLDPTTSTSTSTSTSTTTTTLAPTKLTVLNPTKLQSGRYVWRFRLLEKTLRPLWDVGTNNVILQGALMNFQLTHNLDTTGSMNPATWNDLVSAAVKNQVDPLAYNYVYVRQTLPELLKLYVNGKIKYATYVNTGVSSAPTQSGTYPVYERFLTTTMSGTYPGGGHYSDPGIPWVSYFHGGDALHGFIRSAYGYPQSLGCVEMPFAHAETLFPHTPIGTLVTIQ